MWIEEQESNDEEALERAWSALQHTPSYVERFRNGTQIEPCETDSRRFAWPQFQAWVETGWRRRKPARNARRWAHEPVAG
jgi:hypothetical protein